MQNETQISINKWQRETFGEEQHSHAILKKLQEEMDELTEFMDNYDKYDYWNEFIADLAKELADVQIVLYQLAGSMNIYLGKVVDEKMAINRARKWNVRPGGVAQHIEEKGTKE